MAKTYKTPGVYVEEIATLPPAVAEVSTAIPAFLGYTRKGPPLARITSKLEYDELFGGPKETSFTVMTAENPEGVDVVESVSVDGGGTYPEYLMHYCMNMFFRNGGSSCYVVRAGDYDVTPAPGHFEDALDLLRKEDEPTIIVLVDAMKLESAPYYALCQAVLQQCADLGDRFAVLDVRDGDTQGFRDDIGTNNLKYGAAYHPDLRTALNYHYTDESVSIASAPAQEGEEPETVSLASIMSDRTWLYNQVKAELARQWVVVPPAAVMAGIYAKVDRERGVWKAPANVSVANVIEPVVKISDGDQEDLNVDPTAGKSINAIRSFTGKGTLVWGARTLAGNDNEWRYVPVRRLFNMLEESTRKSTAFAVFEPNDATTWLKVKGMAESFLYGLWERGALAGPTPESAYFVDVGLGKTMTPDDVLNGRMIVRIGVAAVRPAEFIILEFTHKLQEA